MASGGRGPAVNMAEELLETVERLQSRLLDNTEHRKVTVTLIYTYMCVFKTDIFLKCICYLMLLETESDRPPFLNDAFVGVCWTPTYERQTKSFVFVRKRK